MIDFVKSSLSKVTTPTSYLRQFENDLPSKDGINRIALIALPLLCLHQPFGQKISTGLDICRTITELNQTLHALSNGKYQESFTHSLLTAWAVAALAGNYFQLRLGLALTTSADLATNGVHAFQAIRQGNYAKTIDELLLATSSCLYLALLFHGGVQIQFASALLQAALSFLQARKEWKSDRKPECLTKMVLGFAHLHQAHGFYKAIQLRNQIRRIKPIFERLMKAKNVEIPEESPLPGLQANNCSGKINGGKNSQVSAHCSKGKNAELPNAAPSIENLPHVTMTDIYDNSYDFGSHAHGYGGETVKGMNLQFRAHEIDGKKTTLLEFKLQHVARERLKTLVSELQKNSSSDFKKAITLSQWEEVKGIRIENTFFDLSVDQSTITMGGATKITLKGLGSITFGNSPHFPNVYSRVRVETEEHKNLLNAHQLLSFLDLEPVLRPSTSEEIEKLKINTLFHIFNPVKALSMERTAISTKLNVDGLKSAIIKQDSNMENTFEKYLKQMQKTEILPGKMRYTIPGLAQEAKQLGARTLISTLTGGFDLNVDRLGSILKMGLLSSETRYSNGLDVQGLSSHSDFESGSADSVFMQLLTQRVVQAKMKLDSLYIGSIRILISLDILNTGTYQYNLDTNGARFTDKGHNPYCTRPSLQAFVKQQQTEFNFFNEVMAKERVGPEYITGIVVPTMEMRDTLMDYLRAKNLVVKTADQKEWILGKPAEKFVKVSQTVTEELLA